MPAAKALAIRIKEMPTVPESLANLRNEPQVGISISLISLKAFTYSIEI